MQRRKPDAELSNPCFTGDMELLTQDGYKRFDELVGTNPMIINKNGDISQSKVWSSGIKDTVKLRMSMGKEITCTPDHRFLLADGTECEAKDLTNKYIQSFNENLQLNVGNLELVDNVLPNGKHEVYDFEEPLVNWGVVEGLIAHNCFEIALINRQHCNLTIINAMAFVDDERLIDMDGIKLNLQLATKMAFVISLQELDLLEWDKVARSDRIIGVSITGWQDFVNKTNISKQEKIELLQFMRNCTYEENERLSKLYNVKKADLVTSFQPAGTVSILPNSVSAGMHFSHSPYYIRRIRVNSEDPISKAMIDSGYGWKPEIGQTIDEHSTKVFEFAVAAPEGRTKYDVTAIEQMEEYKLLMENYCDQNVSSTIHVRDNEWVDVEQWLWDNWDSFVGLSFLSLDDNFYELLPYEAIEKDVYDEMIKNQSILNIDYLKRYETGEDFEIDDTSGCETGACPIR